MSFKLRIFPRILGEKELVYKQNEQIFVATPEDWILGADKGTKIAEVAKQKGL